MWIFGGYRHWGTYNNVAGSFKDASFTEKLYSCNQDASRQLHDGAEPVPGVAPERGGASDDAGDAEEQGERCTTTGSSPTSATASCRAS